MHRELNDAQRAAVLHRKGALLIIAGAGAGKTRTIVERVGELIRSGVSPERILAVTFTNKAAREMLTRVRAQAIGDPALSPYESPRAEPFIGTFHALSLHMLRSFHTEAGLPARFVIYDRSDSLRAAKQAIEAAGFDPKELEPRRALSVISRAKGDALSVIEFRSRALSYRDETIAEVWERYDALLARERALDFDDILVRAEILLAECVCAREHFQGAWEYLHVDEYQDTNVVQYRLVRALSEKHGNLAVVGDADQNIYSWRGASLSHLLEFKRDFPEATVIVLTENYRSTKTILEAANAAIAKNRRRVKKVLTTENEKGGPITVARLRDEVREARFIARECGRLTGTGYAAEDIAVLYRANFQSRVLEEEFLRAGVPYQVVGTRFFERKEVRDALSYLRLAFSGENAADLARALSAPARGLGKVALARLTSGRGDALPVSQKKKMDGFRGLIARVRNAIAVLPCSQALTFALTESGLMELYREGRGEDEERFENLKELVSVAAKYDALPPLEGVSRLLEEAALQSDQDELPEKREDRPGVKLMTVHAAKGLEFPVVFVAGLEQGLFPHESRHESGDEEEERRLFYVALTRAEKKAYLTWAGTRTIFGARSATTPSEFVTEIDPALVEAGTGYAYDEESETVT